MGIQLDLSSGSVLKSLQIFRDPYVRNYLPT